jgi:hypothetical protein
MIEAVAWDNGGVLMGTETLVFSPSDTDGVGRTTRAAFPHLGLDLTKETWPWHYLGEGKSNRETVVFRGGQTARALTRC